MNQPALDAQPHVVISGRSLLLRLLICVVTVAVLSIGGALLMHATIDPAADAAEGAGALLETPSDTR